MQTLAKQSQSPDTKAGKVKLSRWLGQQEDRCSSKGVSCGWQAVSASSSAGADSEWGVADWGPVQEDSWSVWRLSDPRYHDGAWA